MTKRELKALREDWLRRNQQDDRPVLTSMERRWVAALDHAGYCELAKPKGKRCDCWPEAGTREVLAAIYAALAEVVLGQK